MKEETGVEYNVVYDEDLAMAKNMGLLHEGAIPVKDIDLAQPATLLFDSDGKIIWSYVSTNYRIRPETTNVLVAAQEYFGD